VLLVEQLIETALAVFDRVHVLAQGQTVLAASAHEPNLPRRLERASFRQT
jgi:ABC-type branched-subunit amino acid transport system ATPase component